MICVRSIRAMFSAALLCTACCTAKAQVKVEEKVDYHGVGTNLRISNGTVELILATDYGPRIIRYAVTGADDAGNVFGTVPDVNVKTDLGQWNIRGGHRLWHAPEG